MIQCLRRVSNFMAIFRFQFSFCFCSDDDGQNPMFLIENSHSESFRIYIQYSPPDLAPSAVPNSNENHTQIATIYCFCFFLLILFTLTFFVVVSLKLWQKLCFQLWFVREKKHEFVGKKTESSPSVHYTLTHIQSASFCYY